MSHVSTKAAAKALVAVVTKTQTGISFLRVHNLPPIYSKTSLDMTVPVVCMDNLYLYEHQLWPGKAKLSKVELAEPHQRIIYYFFCTISLIGESQLFAGLSTATSKAQRMSAQRAVLRMHTSE